MKCDHQIYSSYINIQKMFNENIQKSDLNKLIVQYAIHKHADPAQGKNV